MDASISILINLLNHPLCVLYGDALPKSEHGPYYLVGCYIAVVVLVELLEEYLYLLLHFLQQLGVQLEHTLLLVDLGALNEHAKLVD